MKDMIEIGAAPYNEDCAQVGRDDYEARSIVETRAFKAQLARLVAAYLGDAPAPESFRLKIKGSDHDYGKYYEVAAVYDDADEGASNLAWWLQENVPANWDDEARADFDRPAGTGVTP